MIPKVPLAILLFLILCAVLVAGCTSSSSTRGTTALNAAAGQYPVTVTDDLGRPVTLNATPLRIVSLSPSNTEVLYALGLGDRIAGVDVYSNYPPEAASKPTMGGMINVSDAQVIAARPDLVLVSQFTPESTIDNLTAAGLAVFSTHPDNATDTFRSIGSLGDLLGVPDRAAALEAQMKSDVANVTAKRPGPSAASEPTVLMIITLGNESYVADPNGYMGDLIVLAGGRNVATGTTMTPDEIAQADPDIIIVPLTDWTMVTFDSYRNGQEPWMQDLSAVRDGNVYAVSYDVVGRPGPRIGYAAEDLARIIHPELYN